MGLWLPTRRLSQAEVMGGHLVEFRNLQKAVGLSSLSWLQSLPGFSLGNLTFVVFVLYPLQGQALDSEHMARASE